jgi:hypothetical protein
VCGPLPDGQPQTVVVTAEPPTEDIGLINRPRGGG